MTKPDPMNWELVGDAVIDPDSSYLVQSSVGTWRSCDLFVMKGSLVQDWLKANPDSPFWIAKILVPAQDHEAQTARFR